MKERLNILQVCNRVPFPLNDGGNIATYYVAHYLRESGHNVKIATLNTKKHFQSEEVLNQLAPIASIEIDTTITAAGLIKGFFQSTPYNVERFKSAQFETLLLELIKSERPDIIQLEGAYMALYITSLRKITDSPIVLRSHNVEHQIWERMADTETNLLKRIYLKNLSPKIRKFEEETMHWFDAILAITPLDAAYYKAHHFTGPILHFPAGIIAEETTSIDEKKYTIGFLGSLEWLPNLQGVEWFIEKCWKEFHEQHPQFSFAIAGKHIPSDWWVKNIKGIEIVGEVPDAKEFMRQCEVFIVPLLSGGGMRVKVIEAMSQKAAIVSTTIGSEGIEVENQKEILLADSPLDFQQSILTLLKNKQFASKLGEAAYQKVKERYNWKNLIHSLENFYLELISTNKEIVTEPEIKR